MRYKELDPITRDEYDGLFRDASEERAGEALLRLAWHEQEMKWAEAKCAAALTDPRLPVRQAAATALGHIARRQRGLDMVTIASLIALRSDPEIGDHVEDALDDLAIFSSAPPRRDS